MQYYSKHIITPDKEVEGYLTIEDGKIARISATPIDDTFVDYSDLMIMPGYIDIHLHGWGTGAFWQERTVSSLKCMAKDLTDVGVTSFLGTTGADALDNIKTAIKSANEFYGTQAGAQLLGMHLEGPFISKQFKGMQREEDCIDPSLSVMKDLHAASANPDLIKMLTIAPELDGAKDVIEYCKDHNIQCSIGHSGATFETVKEMKKYGIGGVIHMFSGMNSFHHRELGVPGAALYFDDLYCEFAKQTGMTVKHEAFDIALRIKGSDKVYLTTDCTGLGKTQREHYHYIRKERFIPENGILKVQNDDGSSYEIDPTNYEAVKGLELSYEKSVQNVVKHSNVTPFDIMKMTSLNPARFIGVETRKGSITVGKDADFIVLDDDYNVLHTYVLGKQYK